jgi:hypothetical protein
MPPFMYPNGKTIIKIFLPVTSTMLVILVQFVIRGCVATITSTTNAEGLSQFSKGPELCPGKIAWPQVPAPISCDDPGCRGISWAVPPYRCRQHDGVMFGREVFGCPCCPRLVDCDNPICAGSPYYEICQSELLAGCVCVSSRRRAPAPPTRAPFDAAAAAAQVEDALADLTVDEPLNNDVGVITPSSVNCPRDPPVRCLDPQCRGSDDWTTGTSSTPRCNRADGKLVIDGTEIALHGCPCCPEYIACSSTDCNGGANQACTSYPLHGCFCDWPGRGPQLTAWEPAWQEGDPPDILINDADAFLDDPDYHPPGGGQRSATTAVSFTATSSMLFEARPLATQESTASAIPQNFTLMDLLSRIQEAFSLSQNSSVFVIPEQSKHT